MQRLPIEIQRKIFANLHVSVLSRFSLSCRFWWDTALTIPESLQMKSGEDIYGLCGVYYVRLPDKPSPSKRSSLNAQAEIVKAPDSTQPPIHWSWKGENYLILQSANRLVHQGCAVLTELNLSDATLYDDSLRLLSGLTRLQHLDLARSITFLLRESTFLDVGMFTSLKYLDISGCQSIAYDGFNALSSLVNLEQLNMAHLSSALNLEVLSNLTKLKELDISGNGGLTMDGFESLGTLVALEYLKFDGSKQLAGAEQGITDACFLSLAGLTNLMSLDVSFCSAVTDQALAYLAQYHFARLRNVRLSHCWDVTDAGLEALATLPNLTCLELPNCIQITNAGITMLCTGVCAPVLEALDVAYLNITQESLEIISQRLPSLNYLVIRCCNLITDLALLPLAALTQLIYLDMSNCALLTQQGIDTFAVEYAQANDASNIRKESRLRHVTSEFDPNQTTILSKWRTHIVGF